ncbi:RNA-binding protein [Bifidobacterium mongoliense]|jgi:RNA-binding protein|uniref:RNA-binding protein n=2 Tax=Bifidobacterium mongoliense TaxID=518643 RepID=A0A423UE82_9BIFI|nr:RNA-binding protein [Bifidobacterium mongoliense]
MRVTIPGEDNERSMMASNTTTLSTRQRKQLKTLANPLNPMLWIGKNGITDTAVQQADEVLESHELVKCVVQDGAPVDAHEAADTLAQKLHAAAVQVIGHRFVLYRRTDKEGVSQIQLVD